MIKRYSPVTIALMLSWSYIAAARETFNPYALEIGNPRQPVADLSAFAEAGGQQPGVYRVMVYINGEAQGELQDIHFVSGADQKLRAQITPAMLKAWGVRVDAFPQLAALPADKPLDDIGQYIPQAATELRFSKLQLEVSIPQAAINASAREWVDPALWDDGVTAALLNYNFSGANTWHSHNDGSRDNYYANLQSGLNFGAWRLRNYSTWSYSQEQGSRWDSINSWLQRDIKSLKAQLTLGDSYTPGEIFDSVQFRGAQLASDDNMLPDSLRGFAPVIRGIARSNAQVTVRQNGYIIWQSYVAPGAFVISDLYPTAGSGDLDVTIREADGSERRFVQPFAAVPIMQREGRLKYAATAGKYRSGNDTGDEPGFGQLSAMYGLPHSMTVYGGAIYSPDYLSAAVGMGFGLGELGSFSTDITVARTTLDDEQTRNGQSYRVQYSKTMQTTGTSFTLAAYRYSTQGYYTFPEANDMRVGDRDVWRMQYNKRQRLQLDISQSLSDIGSFFISGYQQDYWHRDGEERTFRAGWASNIGSMNYSLTYSYSDYPESTQAADQQLAFTIQVPLLSFMPGAWANYSINTARGGDTRQQVGLNGTLLSDNNLSYSVQQSYTNHGVGAAGNINATYKGAYNEIAGGYSYDDNTQQINYGLKGGIVAHPYGVTFSQSLGDSMALVRAPGAGNTKVQNNTGVYTDWRGYTVVPYVNPYKKNRIALDTSTLAEDVDIDTAVRTVTPGQGAVVVADFDTRVGRRVLMTVSYQEGPVPFGASVSQQNGSSGIVGDGGQVYLTGVADEGDLRVSWNGSQRCTVHYRLPEPTDSGVLTGIQGVCR
ncbi:fimbria/pilus outer membrane usher protein [Entomohabitans teleogrylli]|uniref:fimbria/pilus outer membrane usher protein n=1 Tax=Entomohabitans teleogrylli TaxID=1384589 RepID=UPI00073D1A54|nr:fimbria/pilus outer membrane usher protein [Entomohabitans teleogrylli]